MLADIHDTRISDLDLTAACLAVNQDKLLLPGLFELTRTALICKGKKKQVDWVLDYDLHGYRGLLTAVILQAELDAEHGSKQAADWLKSDLCFDFCFSLGFDHKAILAWLREKELCF